MIQTFFLTIAQHRIARFSELWDINSELSKKVFLRVKYGLIIFWLCQNVSFSQICEITFHHSDFSVDLFTFSKIPLYSYLRLYELLYTAWIIHINSNPCLFFLVLEFANLYVFIMFVLIQSVWFNGVCIILYRLIYSGPHICSKPWRCLLFFMFVSFCFPRLFVNVFLCL